MAEIQVDDIIDRRRLRRKLTVWRVVAVVAVLGCITALAALSLPEQSLGAKSRPHIAKVRVEGTITEDEQLLEVLEKVAESDAAHGVIIAIDSPGGTVAGGEAIYEAVREIAAEKPVTAQVGTLAASAGYMVASATDHIVARQSSIVGSIGVLVQYPNIKGLLEKLGIDVRAIKSSPLKAEPSFFDDPPPGAEEMLRAMILDNYDWFKDIVEERRPLSRAEVDLLADGSVFTGRQALRHKLIDGLGGEAAAIAWLAEEGIDGELDVIEWKKPEPAGGFLLSRIAVEWLGLEALRAAPVAEIADRLLLDGLISVWQVDY
ncbi:signal peptide peptidase SppA [Oricola sp.]|uniref:signal peptide peptidase SppA n=1 Tax=Oricola sp. TaxID=1979950 RepID=UPI003BAB641A